MKKLLILRFPFESRFGGEEHHTIQIAEGLRARGHAVFFAGSDPVLLAEMQSRNFVTKKVWGPKPPVTKKKIFTFAFLSVFFALQMIPVLFLYRMRGVKTAYCLSLPDKFLTLWMRLFGMRVVWVEHARIGRWLTRNPFLPFYWLLAWLAKGVVFTSHLAMQQAPWIPHAVTIPCGINIDEFKNAKAVPLHGVTDSTPVIGVVARFSKDKGINVFLEAAATVQKRFPETIFLCCGDGPEEKNLRALTYKLGLEKHVIFLKTMDRQKLGALYKRLSIVVLPSTTFDPFGLVPGEAMALGKPVVVTDACGIAGYMHNGVDGMVVRAGSVEDLANTLLRLLHDQKTAEKIGTAGQSLIKGKFNEEKMLEVFERLFFNL